MSKRRVAKLAALVAVLGAMTLLQGCYEGEDGLIVRFAWSPVGFAPAVQFGFGPSQGAMGGQGGGGGTGGISAGGVAAAGGGGNQVSGGVGY